MDSKELRNLMEAYSEVYAPQEEIEEASYSAKAARAGKDIGKPGKAFAKIAKEAGKRYGSKERGEKVAGAVLAKLRKEEVDIFDVVLEFLQTEGYAETLEEAEWMMANLIDDEAIEIVLGEASKNDERIRSNIARFAKSKSVEYTPPSNWDASANRGKGATISPKQAEKRRRKELAKSATNEEFEAWLDEAMSNYEKNRKRAAQRAAARNAARDAGQTGAVKGVGYVTPRRERETYTDEKGRTRHAKGL